MTPVLVTGGSGFIGQHLVSALHAKGRRVRILDLRDPAQPPPDVEYIGGSVLDPAAVDEALAGVTEVYHLAGLPGMWMPDKNDFHDVNCRGTEIMLAAAQKRGVVRFLHCSTESILFHPERSGDTVAEETMLPAHAMPGAYTRSKALAEQRAMQAAAAGFPVVIGTPTMPIGAHDHNLTPPTTMLRHFLDRRLHLYLDFIVNLVDVRDAASGLILAMERGRIGQRYVFGGESIRLQSILRIIGTISGRRHLSVPIPGRIAEIAAAMLEFVADHVTRRPPSGTAEGVRIALRSTELSIEKARSELGYAPRPIEPALRETLACLRTVDVNVEMFDMEQRATRVPAE
jgi:dihydroflavonol-4-reductase